MPSLFSLLSGRIVPLAGGATEFASTRAAYEALPEALGQRVETAIAVHDFSWSLDQVRPGFFTEQERAEFPPVRHPVVRTNPVNGRRSLLLGAHASHIVGMPVEASRALLKELLGSPVEASLEVHRGLGPEPPGLRGQPRRSRGRRREAVSSTWASWSPPAKRRQK
jgi:alpha-ketoglutarate-dependent 2,4-dichlorophenoxyacetate dioxygenase